MLCDGPQLALKCFCSFHPQVTKNPESYDDYKVLMTSKVKITFERIIEKDCSVTMKRLEAPGPGIKQGTGQKSD